MNLEEQLLKELKEEEKIIEALRKHNDLLKEMIEIKNQRIDQHKDFVLLLSILIKDKEIRNIINRFVN
jgi:hypothetical protein